MGARGRIEVGGEKERLFEVSVRVCVCPHMLVCAMCMHVCAFGGDDFASWSGGAAKQAVCRRGNPCPACPSLEPQPGFVHSQPLSRRVVLERRGHWV